MTSEDVCVFAAVVQVHPRSLAPAHAEASTSLADSFFRKLRRGSATERDESGGLDGSRDVWCGVHATGSHHAWSRVTVASEASVDVLIVSSEDGAADLIRVPLVQPLAWVAHAGLFGVLHLPTIAAGTLGFHFECEDDAATLGGAVHRALDNGTPTILRCPLSRIMIARCLAPLDDVSNAHDEFDSLRCL